MSDRFSSHNSTEKRLKQQTGNFSKENPFPLAQTLIFGRLSLKAGAQTTIASLLGPKWPSQQTRHRRNFCPETWGFGTESFRATPAASSNISRPSIGGNNAQLFVDSKKIEGKLATQPTEWAGF